jgi:phosphoribosylformylglycinamidine (FGAM) synthase PurS component
MRLQAEVIGRFEHAGDANRLLYTPLAKALTVRGTRRYVVDFTGDEEALKRFLAKVLADPVSHELRTGEAPAIGGYSFFLDYGMKAGALDHEKETILRLHRTTPADGFEIQNLRINHRLYLFDDAASSDTQALADRFVKDIVNPAIHTWQVTAA